MLPEFGSKLFQLPLVATTWTCVHHRYLEERKKSIPSIALILSLIERIVLFVYRNAIQCQLSSSYTYGRYECTLCLSIKEFNKVNKLDSYLCLHIDTIRWICPIVDCTISELYERYGGLLIWSSVNKSSVSSVSSNDGRLNEIDMRKDFAFIQRSFQFLMDILMIIRTRKKLVQYQIDDCTHRARNAWKQLNMEDGRSLEDVDLVSEKIFILGRRMIGNCRQFGYLIRFRLIRYHAMLNALLHVLSQLRAIIQCSIQKINNRKQRFRVRAQNRLTRWIERIVYYLEKILIYISSRSSMEWKQPYVNQTSSFECERSVRHVRPLFFLPSTNTSDCSESDDNLREQCTDSIHAILYEGDRHDVNIAESSKRIESASSDSSSSLSSTSEPCFNTKDVIHQIDSPVLLSSNPNSSTSLNNENQVMQQEFEDNSK